MKKSQRLAVLLIALILAISAISPVIANAGGLVASAAEEPWPTAPPAPTPFAPVRAPEVEENGGFPIWGIILIAGGGLIALGVGYSAVSSVLKKRKKKK